MPYHWPKDADFSQWELDVLDRACAVCGRRMYVCDHRYRRFHTLEGPVELVCKLNHCPDPHCAGQARTKSPELEIAIALPKGAIGWDVLCWIGHRRCSRHWSIPQIQTELNDAYAIQLSADSLSRYVRHYQIMLAARQQDPAALRRQYQGVDSIILSPDGLQPEKGHETLYVVRELTQKRVWFAEPLLSATADEVRRLIAQAKEWAAALGKPVALWLSNRQDAFVTGIAAEFPDVPHRSGTADAARLRPGRRRGRRDPRPGGGVVRETAAEVRGIEGAFPAFPPGDSSAEGPGDAELCGGPLRGPRDLRGDPRPSRSGALVSLTQESRASHPRPSSRGDSDRAGGADTGACLDAQATHSEPFSAADLLPYRTAQEPACPTEAL